MNILRAIKVKKNHQRLHLDEYYQELLEADNLSIEGLERIVEQRTLLPYTFIPRLPGETED